MAFVQIEFGEVTGVSVDGTSLPVVDFDSCERETLTDATGSTQTSVVAPGVASGSTRQTTAVAIVTAGAGAHWVSFGLDPTAEISGAGSSLVLEGQTRVWTVRPGYKGAAIVNA